MRIHSDTRRQLLRYAVIGLLSNAGLYAAYLLLSWSAMGHKTAMTVVYCMGMFATFVFNRSWAFGHAGAIPQALLRYTATYAFGYMFNIAALFLLVDMAGLPHRWVVLALILISACITFLLQKFWVFPAAPLSAAQ